MPDAMTKGPVCSATGDPAYSQTMPRTAESAIRARGLVRTVLAAWHLEELSDPADSVVTELVGNAADHARGQNIRVTVTRTEQRRVRLAVTDMSKKLPEVRPFDLDEESGRGLLLVAAMAKEWGVEPLAWGKRVWADLEAP